MECILRDVSGDCEWPSSLFFVCEWVFVLQIRYGIQFLWCHLLWPVCFLVMVLVSLIESEDPNRDLHGLVYEDRDRTNEFWDPRIFAWGVILIVLLAGFSIVFA